MAARLLDARRDRRAREVAAIDAHIERQRAALTAQHMGALAGKYLRHPDRRARVLAARLARVEATLAARRAAWVADLDCPAPPAPSAGPGLRLAATHDNRTVLHVPGPDGTVGVAVTLTGDVAWQAAALRVLWDGLHALALPTSEAPPVVSGNARSRTHPLTLLP